MSVRGIGVAAVLAVCGSGAFGQSGGDPSPSREGGEEDRVVDRFVEDGRAVLGFTLPSIKGEPVDLASFSGRVVLMVNVASRCGLTPQYAGLQGLFERYEERGLVVLGFPANDFGAQEPGTEEEIRAFCTENFGVTFPMFAKVRVVGEDRHPLFAKLAAATAPAEGAGDGEGDGAPTWNFTKYLVDRSGRVVRRFDPRTAPDDRELVAEIERLLEMPAPEAPGEGPS